MLKKGIVTLVILVLLLFINSFVNLEYGMNLVEYLSSNTPLSEDEIQYLKANATLKYGADHNSPPLRYVNERTQKYEGLSIDYIHSLSDELAIDIELNPLMWTDALKKLKSGEIDVCDMYPSEDRSKDFLFSTPIYYQRGAILIKKDNTTIQSVKDLEGKIISGNEGDLVFEFVKNEFENVDKIESPDLYAAIELLTHGQVDAVLGDESVMNYIVNKEQLKNEYIILNDYLYEREAVLAVRKGNEKLLKIFNKAINSLNRKQTMEIINQKWFGTSPLIIKSNSSDKFLLIIRYVFFVVLLMGLGLYAWNLQLKKEVQKQTNQLRISKNELQTVFNGLTHLMIVIDEDCSVVDANRTFLDRYDFNHDSIWGKHCQEINGILGNRCQECLVKKTFLTNESQTGELELNSRIFKVSTYVLEQLEDMKHKILVMMEDVTDFKLTEQNMLQSTKMAAVGQLAAGIAHEIRTPLGIIRNNLYYMKRSAKHAAHIESMDAIEASVARANKTIDNLLNFSKLTDNIVSESNIYDLIHDIYLLNKKFLKSKKINFSFNCVQPLHVFINTESFKHVMINLINNAVDAMKDGGDLVITIVSQNDDIHMTIWDTGIGMNEKVLSHIFDPFYTTKSKGTGLGLYITYNEVLKMNGTITATSDEFVGTTFTLTIPRDGNKET